MIRRVAQVSLAEFINRYVFPDGQLDNIGNIQRAMETARFEIADVEALRPHYAMTLRTGWTGSSATATGPAIRQRSDLPGLAAVIWPRARWISKPANRIYQCWRASVLPRSAGAAHPRYMYA